VPKVAGNAGAPSAGRRCGCKNILTRFISSPRQAVYFITASVFRYKLHYKRRLSKFYPTTNIVRSHSLNVGQKKNILPGVITNLVFARLTSNSITLSGRRRSKQVRNWSQTCSELKFGLSSSLL